MPRYRIAQVGAGSRGVVHVDGLVRNPDRFEIVGLCDLDGEKLARVAGQFGIAPERTFADAEAMLAETRPDVFCFVTLPDVRTEMVKLAVKYGVRGLAFEKPMATSLREAHAIAELCGAHGIKAVVSHQQKYLTSMQKLKRIVDAGEIGRVEVIRATAYAWWSQLGTHFMDYALWAAGGARAKWVVGHAHGKTKLSDSHPSCDYILGQALLDNGVRLYIECGYLSPRRMPDRMFWVDNRLTVHGPRGYVWADTDGRWGAFTPATGGEAVTGEGETWVQQQATQLQGPYFAEFADWLDDDAKVHSCNVEMAYHGYEVLEGLCLSALDHTRVDLPLDPAASEDVNERMRRELPDVDPL